MRNVLSMITLQQMSVALVKCNILYSFCYHGIATSTGRISVTHGWDPFNGQLFIKFDDYARVKIASRKVNHLLLFANFSTSLPMCVV